MKKKLLAVVLAATVALIGAVSAFAAQVTQTTDYGTGLVVDGSERWNSTGGDQYILTGDFDSTVTFYNDAFMKVDASDGLTRNWFNFVFEIFGGDALGMTFRADAFAWTFGEGAQTPTYTTEVNWDWAKYQEIADETVVDLTIKKTSNTTLTATIDFDGKGSMVYTVTYPDGIPEALTFQVGAEGGIVTILKYKDNNDVEETTTPETTTPEPTTAEPTTEAPTTETGTVTEEPTTVETTAATEEFTTENPLDGPETGDSDATIFLAILSAVAIGGVVILKKNEVTE